GAVHQPDRRRAVHVLPQDVGLAIAVEVPGALDVPGWPRIERTDEIGWGTGRPDILSGQTRVPIHQPNRRRAIVALPQDVRLAVTVEVGGTLDLVVRARIERSGHASADEIGAI